MREVCDGQNLWQWSRQEIRRNVLLRSTIPPKQIIMINEFKYGQTWKIWRSPLSLSLYSTFNYDFLRLMSKQSYNKHFTWVLYHKNFTEAILKVDLLIAETFNTTSHIFITNLAFSVQNLSTVSSKVTDLLKIPPIPFMPGPPLKYLKYFFPAPALFYTNALFYAIFSYLLNLRVWKCFFFFDFYSKK